MFHWNASSTSWPSSLPVEVADLGEQRLLRLVDVLDEVDDAAGVLVRDLLLVVVGAFIAEADLEALVEERHHLEPFEDRLRAELDGLEDVGSGQNVTVVPVRPAGRRRRPRSFVFGCRRRGTPCGGACRRDRPRRRGASKRVDHRHADAVQSAGDLVAVAAELSAAVKLRERDLDTGQLVLAVDVDRDASAVVDDLAAAVGLQRDVDARCEPRHGLVDRVVDNLPNEVVQPGRAGAADVHAGPLADRFEAFEDLHVPGPVRASSLRQDAPFQGVDRQVLPWGLSREFAGQPTGSRWLESLPAGCDSEGAPGAAKAQGIRGRSSLSNADVDTGHDTLTELCCEPSQQARLLVAKSGRPTRFVDDDEEASAVE